MIRRCLSSIPFIFLILTSFSNSAYCQNHRLPVIIINEIHNEDYVNDNMFIELLVLKIDEIPNDLNDSAPKVVLDETNQTNLTEGFITIDPNCLSDLNPGSLIVIHGESTDISNFLQEVTYFTIKDPCIQTWQYGPANNPISSGSKLNDPSATLSNYLSLAGDNNSIELRVTENFVTTVNLSDNNSRSAGSNYSLNSNNFTNYGPLGPTAGGENNDPNGAMIETLGGNPCFTENFIVEYQIENVNDLLVQSEGPGGHSYYVDDELIGGSLAGTNGGSVEKKNLSCGYHTLKVETSEGCEQTYTFEIDNPEYILIDWCDAAPFNLNSYACIGGNSGCIEVHLNDEFESHVDLSTLPEDPENSNEPGLDDILMFDIETGQNIFTIINTSGQGDIIGEWTVEVNVIASGTNCNDLNPCTIDDIIDENCNCTGDDISFEANILEECTSSSGLKLSAALSPEDLSSSVEYIWNNGETTASINVNIVDTYSVTVSFVHDEGSCSSISEYTVSYIPTDDTDSDNDGVCDEKEQINCFDNSPSLGDSLSFPCQKEKYFFDNGFNVQLSVEMGYGTAGYLPCSQDLSSSEWNQGTIDIKDYTIKSNGIPELTLGAGTSECPLNTWRDNLINNLKAWQDSTGQQNINSVILITDNQSMCDVSDAEAFYESTQIGIWIHLWMGMEGGCIFYKGKGVSNQNAYNFLFPTAEKQYVCLNAQPINKSLTSSLSVVNENITSADDGDANVKLYCNAQLINSDGNDIKAVLNEYIEDSKVYSANNNARIQYIISAEGVTIGPNGKPGKSSGELAKNQYDNSDSDFTMWLHHNKDETFSYCLKINNVDHSNKIQEVTSYATKNSASNISSSATIATDLDGIGGDPWRIGKRDTYGKNVNIFSVSSQIFSISKSLAADQVLPSQCWDDLSSLASEDKSKVMWDFSGGLCGLADGSIQNNPGVQVIQSLNLVKAVCSGEIKKEQILEFARHPIKIAIAYAHEEWDQYQNDPAEVQNYKIARFGMEFLFGFLNKIANYITSVNKPNVVVEPQVELNGLTNQWPSNLNNPLNVEIKKHLKGDLPFDLFRDMDDVSVLREHLKTNPLQVKAWKALFPDEFLRKNPDKLAKVDDYATNFGKSFDDIGDEFANVPASQRSGWVDHLEFRTKGTKVNKAGGKADDYGTYNSNADVPQKYSSDSRFDDLATDPATGQTDSATRQEAMAGLEAESQGLLDGPISRDATGGAEFVDANGIDWDVKAPPGNFFTVNSVGNSIKSELLNPGVKILFDATWIDDVQLGSLRTWLSNNLSASDLERIVEVNSNLF